MPSNVEIKARVNNCADLRTRAQELSGSDGEILEQEDTFFVCENGRLKLRILKDNPAELIYYDRPDQAGPKLSDFHKVQVENPEDLKKVLGLSLGVRGVVKKKRFLYMVGQTRVHVDQVHGLGDFMELEVMLKEGQSAEEGQAVAHDLMQKLGIKDDDLLTCAYMDLILKEKSA
ncbi:adenylate cyclase CyaB-like [Babylonia areolata]|uniref:adenylate cyclase CyaB-like n=1 Tax=Babylonia areolata TaxID=304850 RepID=UPI003FCF003A